jgi:CRP-like cAMP-binding protein
MDKLASVTVGGGLGGVGRLVEVPHLSTRLAREMRASAHARKSTSTPRASPRARQPYSMPRPTTAEELDMFAVPAHMALDEHPTARLARLRVRVCVEDLMPKPPPPKAEADANAAAADAVDDAADDAGATAAADLDLANEDSTIEPAERAPASPLVARDETSALERADSGAAAAAAAGAVSTAAASAAGAAERTGAGAANEAGLQRTYHTHVASMARLLAAEQAAVATRGALAASAGKFTVPLAGLSSAQVYRVRTVAEAARARPHEEVLAALSANELLGPCRHLSHEELRFNGFSRAAIGKRLRAFIPFLSTTCDETGMRHLLEHASFVSYARYHSIFRAGGACTALTVRLDGDLSARAPDGVSGKVETILLGREAVLSHPSEQASEACQRLSDGTTQHGCLLVHIPAERLPPALCRRLKRALFADLLKTVTVLCGLPEAAYRALAEAVELRSCARGESLFRARDGEGAFVFLLRGSAAVRADAPPLRPTAPQPPAAADRRGSTMGRRRSVVAAGFAPPPPSPPPPPPSEYVVEASSAGAYFGRESVARTMLRLRAGREAKLLSGAALGSRTQREASARGLSPVRRARSPDASSSSRPGVPPSAARASPPPGATARAQLQLQTDASVTAREQCVTLVIPEANLDTVLLNIVPDLVERLEQQAEVEQREAEARLKLKAEVALLKHMMERARVRDPWGVLKRTRVPVRRGRADASA